MYFRTGYDGLLFNRPEVHNLLLTQIPEHKVHYGRRVVSVSHRPDGGVKIETSDGSTHECDILIGTDGTYSDVRQSLYKLLKEKGKLPESDTEELKATHMSITGTTVGLDASISSLVEKDWGRNDAVIGYHKLQTVGCNLCH
jgi:2-polyprenyl-6-methoxyphenol hydroxylase-like FAD-dependent oxidoreductase